MTNETNTIKKQTTNYTNRVKNSKTYLESRMQRQNYHRGCISALNEDSATRHCYIAIHQTKPTCFPASNNSYVISEKNA